MMTLSPGPRRSWPSSAAELESIALELARRQRDEKLRYFQPTIGQARWINEISRPGSFIVVNGGGNGSGKTYGLVAILGAFMWPALNQQIFSAPIFQQFPHPKRIRIASTPAELGDLSSIQSSIEELWPRGRYWYDKKGRTYPCQFRTDTGWVLDLMSYEQAPKEYAGPSIGVAAINEPPPEPIYNELLTRLRRGGILLGAMTSLRDNPWVVHGIFGKVDGKDIRVVFGDVEENCKDHTPGGTLSHLQVERILSKFDPDEREARKTGKPLIFAGRIFRSFDRAAHVSAEPLQPRMHDVTRYMVCDPAIGKPLAMIWADVDASGIVRIYDEWPEFQFEGARDLNMTVKDYVALIRAEEGDATAHVRILDRHFGNARRTLGGKSLKDEFEDSGIAFDDSYTMEQAAEVETGILKVKDLLRWDPSRQMDSLNRPRLLVSPTCKNVITAMENWVRDPKTAQPREEYKDFSDCVRYLCMADPKHETGRRWETGDKPYFQVAS